MLRVFAALCALACLGACASPYVATPYDHAQNSSVHALVLAPGAMPQKAMAYEVASTGANFGLIGALIDAGIQSSRQDAVNKALNDDGFNAESQLQSQVVHALEAQGYTVKPLNGPREKREFLTSYPTAEGPVDAYVDVMVGYYGYMSAGAGQPFRPTMGTKVRLVSAKDTSHVLMENMIVYNPIFASQGIITLTPNADYTFKNRSELLADPKRLEAGIQDAIGQTADTIARLLK